MNLDISVIIPVYNTEWSKLKKCVESIVLQSYKAKEIILVDDGSTKECALRCDELTKIDDSVKVFHKKNEGSAVARNFGVDKSSGDYIMFVDSDDIIANYTFEECVMACERYSYPDLIMGLVKKYDDSDYSLLERDKKVNATMFMLDAEKEHEKLMDHILGNSIKKLTFEEGYIGDGPVARLVKMECAKQAPFSKESMFSDDTIWNIRLIKTCNRVVIVDDVWYAYLVCKTSKTRKYRENGYSEFAYRIHQEKNMISELWPTCTRGMYIKIWRETVLLGHVYVFHKDNPTSFIDKFTVFKNSVKLDDYREMLKNIKFETEVLPKRSLKKELLRFVTLHGPYLISYFLWKKVCGVF